MESYPTKLLKPITTRNKRSFKILCHRQIACLAIYSLHLFIRSTNANVDERNKEAAKIYPYPNFTKFKSKIVYIKEPIYPKTTVDFVSNLSHYVYDRLILDASALPYGYIKTELGTDSLNLGTKVDKNDWSKLLAHYWAFLLLIIFLLILVIFIPFVAVCYCCFHWYRCAKGCPTCETYKDARQRCCLGLILAMLLIAILFCAIIGFQNSVMLNIGLGQTSGVVQRGTQTFCSFLKDVSEHIHHLLVNNCEELIAHMTYVIKNLNLIMYTATVNKVNLDKSKNLSRVFDKMPEAAVLMKEVEIWQKDLKFYGGQLRDGLRTIKRDINYACTVLCGNKECLRFLETSDVQNLDSSKCLHFDMLPNPTVYAIAMEDIVLNNYYAGKQQCDDWLTYTRWDVGIKMMKAPLLKDVEKGKDAFRIQGDIIRNLIEEVVNELHANTVKSSGSFDDIYDKFKNHRNIVDSLACGFLVIILICLGVGLIFGCCGWRRRSYQDGFCSKNSGARCLFLGIMLIFSMFSFIILVGIFYLVLGLITYVGVCAPLRHSKGMAVPQLDTIIDVSKFKLKSATPDQTDDDTQRRVSKVFTQCRPNQTILNLIKEIGVYNIDDLYKIKIMGPQIIPTTSFFDYCIDCYECFNNVSYMDHFMKIFETKLSTYKGTKFTDHLCTNVTPIQLPHMIGQLRDLRSSLWSQWGIYDWARISLYEQIITLQKYQDEFYFKVIDLITKIIKNILKIDENILFERKEFGESLKLLFEYTKANEKEMRKIANDTNTGWRRQLPEHLEDQVKDYIRMVIRESHTNVGKCDPIIQVHTNSVEKICHQIVDPLNGLAIGLLFGGLFLLPAVFLAHRLMCLYSKIYPKQMSAEDGRRKRKENAYDSEDAISYCKCNEDKKTRSESSASFCTCHEVYEKRHEGGAAMEEQESFVELTVHEEPSSSKRKQE